MRILVVVASTQAGTLRAEVGKGSMRTAVGHGLVGPKRSGDAVPRVHDCVAGKGRGGGFSLPPFKSLCRGGSHRILQDGGVDSWQHESASCSWQGTEALLLVLAS